MRIILNVDVPGLGEEGDRVEVRNGYARNYLIPKKMALLDTMQARAYFASRAKAIEQRKEEKRQKARAVKDRLAEMEVKFTMPATETGRIFGSVTSNMICDYLAREGITIERKKIEVDSKGIKTAGIYSFIASLYGGDTQTVRLVVEAEKKEQQKEQRKPRWESDVEDDSEGAAASQSAESGQEAGESAGDEAKSAASQEDAGEAGDSGEAQD